MIRPFVTNPNHPLEVLCMTLPEIRNGSPLPTSSLGLWGIHLTTVRIQLGSALCHSAVKLNVHQFCIKPLFPSFSPPSRFLIVHWSAKFPQKGKWWGRKLKYRRLRSVLPSQLSLLLLKLILASNPDPLSVSLKRRSLSLCISRKGASSLTETAIGLTSPIMDYSSDERRITNNNSLFTVCS